jgi:hypothetical protein
MAGWGIKGLIDFPLQDTLAPFGWEAPFSNAFYGWDAAFQLVGLESERWEPTSLMFQMFAFYGPALAEARRVSEVGVAYDGRGDAFRGAAFLKTAFARCRAEGIACDAIDPLAVTDARLATFRAFLLPAGAYPALRSRASRLHIGAVESLDAVPGASHTPGVTLLRGPHGAFLIVENWGDAERAFDARSWPSAAVAVQPFFVEPRSARIIPIDVDLAFLSARFAHGDRLTSTCRVLGVGGDRVPVFGGYPPNATAGQTKTSGECDVNAVLGGEQVHWKIDRYERVALRTGALAAPKGFSILDRLALPGVRLVLGTNFEKPWLRAGLPPGAHAYRTDAFEDGASNVVLQNDRVLALIVPGGGARAISFGPYTASPLDEHAVLTNIFDATGGLRDDVLIQQRPSKTDRIARYTHQYPAGTFNRSYSTCTFDGPRGAGVYLAYDAPDVAPNGARFERVVTVGTSSDRLIVDERFTPHGSDLWQRLVSVS